MSSKVVSRLPATCNSDIGVDKIAVQVRSVGVRCLLSSPDQSVKEDSSWEIEAQIGASVQKLLCITIEKIPRQLLI